MADKKEPVSKPEKTEAERGIEKVWFEWQAPERTFQRRNRDFWITAISILVLVGVILIFIKEFYLIVALMSALFLYYGLSTVPPSTVTNKITNKAVYFGDLRYEWELLRRFWFKTSVGHEQLLIETNLRFPGQIALLIQPQDQDKIKEMVAKKIPYMEASPTFIDRLTRWFADRLPLEPRKES